MLNLISYAKKHSNLTFEEHPFNNVDGVIFSMLPYLNYQTLKTPISLSSMTIHDIGKVTAHSWNGYYHYQLLNIMKNSLRYGQMKFLNFTSKFSYGKEQNFAALSIEVQPELYFVGYRGTESNFIDWKEDLNLSFMKEIPSRLDATLYLENLLNSTTGKIIVGGHSKGGDLASFSFKHISKNLQNRVLKSYNIDGPTSIKTKHHNLQSRMIKLVPQTSLIGIIMDRSQKFQVVKSNADMLEQHNPFTWIINDHDFQYLAHTDKFSTIIQGALTTWQQEFPANIKKEFINFLFNALTKTGHTSITDFSKNWTKNTIHFLKEAHAQPKSTRQLRRNVSSKFVTCLLRSARKNFSFN